MVKTMKQAVGGAIYRDLDEMCAECGNPLRLVITKNHRRKVCPVCCDHQKEELEIKSQRNFEDSDRYKRFRADSLINDKGLRFKTFDTYQANNGEQATALQSMKRFVEEYKKGHPIHGVLAGSVGTGKSHLAMSTCNEILKSGKYGDRVVFVNWAIFHAEALKAQKYKDVMDRHQQRLEAILDADFVVLDDLGAENINQEREIGQINFNLISQILEARHDKALLITTNKSSVELQRTYKERNWSRLSENLGTVVKFEQTKDFRRNISW